MSRTPSFQQLMLDFRLAMYSVESDTSIEKCLKDRKNEISRRGLIKGEVDSSCDSPKNFRVSPPNTRLISAKMV